MASSRPTSNSTFAITSSSRNWTFAIGGCALKGAVDKPLELNYDELGKLAVKTQPALLECAGNGRSFLEPKAKGVPWQLGAVGNAIWTGVSLVDLLQMAGVRKTAVEVLLVGADAGELKDDPKPIGKVHFARSLPLLKALQPEVLLAYQMNGKPLTPEHGYPLRAVVPGWYGMASVKWLTRVIVLEQPFGGYFQTFQYSYFAGGDGLPVMKQINTINVKSQIARPVAGEKIAAGQKCRVFGAAWAGPQQIAKVEVSTDGGASWQSATLLEKPVNFCWRLWEFIWTPSKAGKYVLMVRATDMNAREQPIERDPNRRNYLVNHVLPVEVTVE